MSLVNVKSQQLVVTQLASCQEDRIPLGAVTNGEFLGWQKNDGSKTGILTPDSTATWVRTSHITSYVATARFRAENLIKNGDFEKDTVGLLTDYTYRDRIDQPGDYSIVTNPNAGRSTSVYALIGDHTSGTGKMMIADGDTNFKVVFRAKIPVVEGSSYALSAWIANIHKKLIYPNVDTSANKLPRLKFTINSESLGVYHFPFDSLWHSFNANWVAPKSDTVFLEIIDLQKALKANDFALDDIDFRTTYTKQAVITVSPCTKTDVFSPDGDGILDTYYIEEPGVAKIFDLDGNLVHELSVPAHWDGTKRNGLLADAGYYAVVINEAKSYRVSLMR